MPVLEKSIELRVKRWAKDMDVLYLKVRFYENGYPDRLMIYPNGLHVWWEAKRPKEVPEPIQNHRIDTLRKRNALAFWTDNYEDTIIVLQAILDSPLVPEESDSAFALASIRRAISRSGARKDGDLPSYFLDLKETRLG